MNYRLFLLFILILNIGVLRAQLVCEKINNNNIRSVHFGVKDFELAHPIFCSESQVPLQLKFDLLGTTQPALAYRLLHCEANWTQSTLSPTDYLHNTFNEFYITNYQSSRTTRQLYTHYTTQIFPEQLKLSGNYVIQIFPEDAPDNVWLQMRFCYAECQTTITGNIIKPTSGLYQDSHQRVQFEVIYEKSKFTNARSQLKTVVVQNLRWTESQELKALFINDKKLRFSYIDKRGLFPGNYEFPYFDTSNTLQETQTIRTLEQDENREIHCYLYPNEAAPHNYFYIKDMNGSWAVKAENTFAPDTEADYIWVHFTFVSKKRLSPIYIVGRFNQWNADETCKLKYDETMELYHLRLLLKQGVYNYTFISKETNGRLKNLLGNYSETENDYYVFVYYHDEHFLTDRLLGWKRIKSKNN